MAPGAVADDVAGSNELPVLTTPMMIILSVSMLLVAARRVGVRCARFEYFRPWRGHEIGAAG
jgi:hypothetical protein